MGHAGGRHDYSRHRWPGHGSAALVCGMRGENFKTVGDFSVAPGEEVPFVLSFARSHQALPEPVDVVERLAATEEFWTTWAGRNKIEGPWGEAVTRSLIVLKALTYAPTGGMAAAPSTSLPEFIGGFPKCDSRPFLLPRPA